MSVQVKGSGTIGGLDEGLVVSGIVTSSTQVNVGSNIKLGNAGVVTATSFVGSGANLTSLPAQATIANNADNRVITGGSGVNLNGEATLTYDGNQLNVVQTTSSSDSKVVVANSNTPGSGGLRLEFQYGTGTTEGTNRFRFGYVEGYRAGGSNDGGLKFGTKPGNADAPTERLRINPKGQISIKGTTTAFDTTGDLDSLQLYYETDSGQASIGPYSSGGSTHLSFYTNASGAAAVERLRIDSSGNLKFNSGYGSVNTAYGIRAWIAFKAAGGSNTVRGSGNATITDHGTGDFTMNFTTAMPDTGYSAVGTAGYNSGIIVLGLTGSGTESSPTTSGFRFTIRANYSNSTLMDEEYINLMVVR